MKSLNTADFKSNIWNFTDNKDWKYEGKNSVVIKFGADWCAPCKSVEKTLTAIESEYLDDVDFYLVNVDEETEITEALRIMSLPTIYFIDATGNKTVTTGSMSIDKLREKIDVLL